MLDAGERCRRYRAGGQNGRRAERRAERRRPGFLYVAAYERTFVGVVAEETYRQEVRGIAGTDSRGFAAEARGQRRDLKSDMLLVRAPAGDGWIQRARPPLRGSAAIRSWLTRRSSERLRDWLEVRA